MDWIEKFTLSIKNILTTDKINQYKSIKEILLKKSLMSKQLQQESLLKFFTRNQNEIILLTFYDNNETLFLQLYLNLKKVIKKHDSRIEFVEYKTNDIYNSFKQFIKPEYEKIYKKINESCGIFLYLSHDLNKPFLDVIDLESARKSIKYCDLVSIYLGKQLSNIIKEFIILGN